MRHFARDLRLAYRRLRLHTGFTIVAAASLALGIGASSTVFSAVSGVLLKPLAFDEPQSLVRLHERYIPKGDRLGVSPRNFQDWRELSRAFRGMALFVPERMEFEGGDEPLRLQVAQVSEGFFSLIGGEMPLGRGFSAEEDRGRSESVAVLSHGFWTRRYAAARQGVLRSTISMGGLDYTIVGVAPPSYSLLDEETEVWIPMRRNLRSFSRGERAHFALARLGREVTLQEARSELSAVADALSQEFPRSNRDWGVSLVPLREDLLGDTSNSLLPLLGAVGFVMLIACANVANLLLARSERRDREIAVRAALGATRGRLVAQLFAESLLLAAICGALGLLLSMWGVDLLSELYSGWLPRADEIGIDWRVVLFTLVTALAAAAAFGLSPALKSSRPDLVGHLKETGATTSPLSDLRARRLLAVSEIALAMVLLIGAGLMVRSFLALRATDPGYDPQEVLAVQLSPSQGRYPGADQRRGFLSEVRRSLEALRGVESTALANVLPIDSHRRSKVILPRPSQTDLQEVADCYRVTPGYFRTMGIPLLQGQDFDEDDIRYRRRMVVLSQALAERLWQEGDPIGRFVEIRGRPGRWRVTGIAGDVLHDPESRSALSLYTPFGYRPDEAEEPYVLLRSGADIGELAPMVHSQLHLLDPSQAVDSVEVLQSALIRSSRQERFYMLLLSGFAIIAVAMASVGIFGVLAFVVAERSREIGIRIAFGAGRREVMGKVLGQGLGLALAGVGAGIVLAALLSRFLSGLAHEVRAVDPASYLLYSLGLTAIVLLACSFPALKATRLDPVKTLRHQ